MPGRKLNPDTRRRVVALKAKEPELTNEQIGQRFGLHSWTVSRLINEHRKQLATPKEAP